MAISLRNQLPGKVSAAAGGAVNDEIELILTGGTKLVAIVTHNSRETLELKRGKDVSSR